MSIRRYVASGRGGLGAMLAVLAASLLGGVLVGVVEGLVSRWISLFILFPMLIGAIAGATGAAAVARFKLRAPAIALVLGFVGGAVGYATTHAISYLQFRSAVTDMIKKDRPTASDAELSTALDELLVRATGSPGFRGYLESAAREGVRLKRAGSSDDVGLSLKGTAAWIVWALELLAAAAIAGGLAWVRARQPFCEDCQLWYGSASLVANGLGSRKEAAKRVMSALEVGDVDSAARALSDREARSPVRLELTAANCPRCTGDTSCVLSCVVVQKKKTQRSKLATWLMPRQELAQLTSAVQRAGSPPR
jgi:hypothetical protein